MTTDITELAQSLKATAEKWQEAWGKYDKVEITIAEFIRAAEQYESIVKDPANILALVEALEKAHQRIAELISENAALKGSVENAAGCIDAAYFEGLADALAESSDERLVDLVKRRLLHAYLPVETPATDDALVAMGDAVLLEQLEDSRKAIVSQTNIIGVKEKRIAELDAELEREREKSRRVMSRIAELEGVRRHE